jgi:hypothetical protein
MKPVALCAALTLAGCGGVTPLDPPTPPLLQEVGGAGGWWNGGCPPDSPSQRPEDEALSPELTERMRRAFPPGSDARRLEATLRNQGFHFRSDTCSSDVRVAEFGQTGGGFAGPYPMFAQIAWSEGADRRLLWIKSTVSFTGP